MKVAADPPLPAVMPLPGAGAVPRRLPSAGTVRPSPVVVILLLVYDALWLPVVVASLLLRMLQRSPHRQLALQHRLGQLPQRPARASVVLWVHAISIGELLSTRPLLAALKRRNPDWWVILTVGNQPAYELAQQDRNVDAVCWQPWDARWCIERALARVRPDLLVLVECELWPNMIARARRWGAELVIMNARIYERDFARYRVARSVFTPLLGSISLIGAQSRRERDRFLALGAPPERTVVVGNTKFDAAPPANMPGRSCELREALPLRSGPLWVLASTHAGEEKLILDRFAPVRAHVPGLQLLIAPRHIDRAPSIQQLAQQFGLSVALRSRCSACAIGAMPPDVIVLDTLGELPVALGLADLVFVGGSLVDAGGHNPIEAALHGRAILYGPSHYNFRDVIAAFQSADALQIVENVDELMTHAAAMLADPLRRQTLGQRAAAVVRYHVGATHALLAALEGLVHGD